MLCVDYGGVLIYFVQDLFRGLHKENLKMYNLADTIRCGLALGILFFGVFTIINLLMYFNFI